MRGSGIIIHRASLNVFVLEADITSGEDGKFSMKTVILVAFTALSLSAGVAYAQGIPPGFRAPAYGAQAFANLHNATSDRSGSGATSAKGG
jgi:hypothetical protein